MRPRAEHTLPEHPRSRRQLHPATLPLGLVFLSTLVIIPKSPLLYHEPGTDSGVFLYVAERMLAGDLPYRDAWDNKPPMIFYIDAVALLISRTSLWGIWLLEFLSLEAALVLGYLTLKSEAGSVPSLAASVVWLFSLGPLLAGHDANYVETFALPLQFAALYCLVRSTARRGARWGWFVIGVTGAAAFLLRPTQVGIWVSIVTWLVVKSAWSRDWRHLRLSGTAMALGAVCVFLPVGAQFVVNHAVPDFVAAVFLYNFAYSGGGDLRGRVGAVLAAFRALSPSGLTLLAVAGWIAGIASLLRLRQLRASPPPLLLVALLDLPIELLLISASPRQFDHYAIVLLPVGAVLSAFVFAEFHASTQRRQLLTAPAISGAVWLVGLLIGSVITPFGLLLKDSTHRSMLEETRHEVVEYLRRETRPGDSVLIWGVEPGINFASGRPSPSRYAHQLQLYTPGLDPDETTARLLADLATRVPALIVDTSPSYNVPPIDARARARWAVRDQEYRLPAEANRVFAFVCEHYEYLESIGPSEWPIYAHVAGARAMDHAIPLDACDEHA